MTAKYYKEKYPLLIIQASKIISAMESECQKTQGKIFDKLAEMLSERPFGMQNECAALLNLAMIEVWKFNSKSLIYKNKERVSFKKELEAYFRNHCAEAKIDDNVLIEHMWCALRAVWRNIEKDINEQNMRISFYDTKLTKYSKKLNI